MSIGLKYILFAILAMTVNIFFQYLSFLLIDHKYELYIAILNGTILGMILKYYLDKNFIFYYVKKEFNNKNIFLLYIFTSIFTTIIFWAIELWFSYYVNITYSEYLGALVGLTLGYSLKYILDKHLVFNNQS
ncbi:GtrA family protein [bacterium TMED221]|nr:MAG: GtrA family protein [bacterium TMED221]|tara:strand:+ start:601 stop:996 length:396 start_codon:yes stop_codon:yes gene_type:complete